MSTGGAAIHGGRELLLPTFQPWPGETVNREKREARRPPATRSGTGEMLTPAPCQPWGGTGAD